MELKDMKVFIDPGHGGSDPGATAGTTQEKNITLYVAKKLQSILSSWGVPTKMTRTGDTFVDTTEIAGISNNWGADIFVSIHCNAGGGNGGTETFTKRSYTDLDNDLAKRIQSRLVTAFDSINRGVKRTNWNVLVGNNACCCLTELLFMDVSTDISKLRDSEKLDSAALAIANGLNSYVFANFHNV
ncbi:N-acetylmuramoyl-L-alanine amidase [Desulfosporosinus nitroreducens]|uniref:N-acetylmuramoyl-L-alanine amidase n=1 Tax=Desulfosporosinus nitroreducens TaxID=2018668 RepID=UPI00207C56CA|nr:N-acetylmuramoyl-L-alanine amidase [Desulfosporosinus nitroreducens]MCO1602765.1 N-acetylmuramoyl-L-alanine amidase [Desulfosporosinus nitroreducens]